MNERTGCILMIGLVLLVLCLGAIAIGSAGGDWAEDLLGSKDNAHYERMREMETEQERQNARKAEALAQEARAQVEIERERAAQELAKQRQREYEVEWERAAGDRSEAEANAYNIRQMSNVAAAAIQRQGRLLSLSFAQQYFFGGVMGLALVAVVVLMIVLGGGRNNQTNASKYPVIYHR